MNHLCLLIIIIVYLYGIYTLLTYQREKTLLYYIWMVSIIGLTLIGGSVGFLAVLRRRVDARKSSKNIQTPGNRQNTVKEPAMTALSEHKREDGPHATHLKNVDSSLPELPDEKGTQADQISSQDDETAGAAVQSKPIDWRQAKIMTGDIVIPDCMTEIRDRLFYGNENITSALIPGTVKRIRECAFMKCAALHSIILEEGIEEIENHVFTGCGKLKHVVYPDSVKRHTGYSFVNTMLETPVINTSGTTLVYCPPSEAGRSWKVPNTVRVIGRHAFFNQEMLEDIQLPDGLEEIQGFAFLKCGLVEILIPASVRNIRNSAFAQCKKLEKVTLLGRDTEIATGAFTECPALKEICSERSWMPDEEWRMKGIPFLKANASMGGNLDHTTDKRFALLTSQCSTGDVKAMRELADWFDDWSQKPKASAFYERAANYWRYRAYQGGEPAAKAWFDKWFAANPGERLEAIMPEYADESMNLYSYSLNGKILNDLGFSFFSPHRDYDLRPLPNEGIVEVSSFESYESPDEDGFGAEYYYDWWYLDENLLPFPGIEVLTATHHDKRHMPKRFDEALATARKAVAVRKRGSM